MVSIFFLLSSLLSCLWQTHAQFTVEPVSVVQAEGLDAEFECLYPGALSYLWIINGIGGVLPHTAAGSDPTVDSPARLSISSCNDSIIECEVFIEDSAGNLRIELSENSTLLFQGPLSSVNDLTVSSNSSCSELLISWSAPFSLNLTTADPDIQYCVDVYNVTGGGSHHLDSVCGITDTQYTYTAPDPTGVYNSTVTPRSNIQGSLNGTTSQPVQFSYPVFPPANEFSFVTNTDLNPLQLQVVSPSSAITTCQELLGYSVSFNDSQGSCSCPTSTSMEGNITLLTLDCQLCGIERHRQYNLTLIAGGMLSEPTLISTHDVYELKVASVVLSEVEIVSKYLMDSAAIGYFVVLYSESADHALYRVVYRNGSEPSTSVTMSGLRASVYRLRVYDLTDNNTYGFLQPEQQPAVPNQHIKVVQGADLESTPASADNITVGNLDGHICIVCYSTGFNGCVGVVRSPPLDNLTVITSKADIVTCTRKRFEGEVSVAVFDVRDKRLRSSPIYVVNFSLPGREECPADNSTWLYILLSVISFSAFSLLCCVSLVMCVRYLDKLINPVTQSPEDVLRQQEIMLRNCNLRRQMELSNTIQESITTQTQYQDSSNKNRRNSELLWHSPNNDEISTL